MFKKFFSIQFVDLLTDFLYDYLHDKNKTKKNIKQGIVMFEDTWVSLLRRSKKNDKRKS